MDKNIKNKAEELIKDLIQKIDNNPYDAQAYYNLGVALNDAHSSEQAEELFKKALNIFVNSKEKSSLMHYGLGNVYYTNSMYDKAIVEFKKVQSEKLKQDSMLMMAQAYYAQENYPQAMMYALTVSENTKHNVDAISLLASCFMATGDLINARKYYLKALEYDKDSAEVLFQLGVIELSLSGEADKYFNRVKNLDDEYYKKMQQRLVDVQRFLMTQKKGKSDE